MDYDLILAVPTVEHEQQAINLIDEASATDIDPEMRFAGFANLAEYRDNYLGWLDLLKAHAYEETLPVGRVPASTFFSVRKSDGKVVGIIDIRHRLNDYLLNYAGHIGYTILPSERRNCYGYQQLMLALDFCKSIGINRVLITCADDNVASAKTIEKAGGVLENKILNTENGRCVRRYWVDAK